MVFKLNTFSKATTHMSQAHTASFNPETGILFGATPYTQSNTVADGIEISPYRPQIIENSLSREYDPNEYITLAQARNSMYDI